MRPNKIKSNRVAYTPCAISSASTGCSTTCPTSLTSRRTAQRCRARGPPAALCTASSLASTQTLHRTTPRYRCGAGKSLAINSPHTKAVLQKKELARCIFSALARCSALCSSGERPSSAAMTCRARGRTEAALRQGGHSTQEGGRAYTHMEDALQGHRAVREGGRAASPVS